MQETKCPLSEVKALFFDVFGTAVDWRSTITRVLHQQSQNATSRDGSSIPPSTSEKASHMVLEDWGRFAAEWRETQYEFARRTLEAMTAGQADTGKTIDEHTLETLVGQIKTWGLDGLWDEDSLLAINKVWHSLDAWPDVVEGIKAFNAAGYQTCTLSNGTVESLETMAKHAGLAWTHVFSAADFQSFKPDPSVYLGAAARLALKPDECCMVACHLFDLEAAAKLGLRTLYVERDREEAWSEERVVAAREWVDVWVDIKEDGFRTAAARLEKLRS